MGQIHVTIFFTLFKSLYIDTRCLEQLPATLSSLENHSMMIFEKYVKQRTIITTTRTKGKKERPHSN